MTTRGEIASIITRSESLPEGPLQVQLLEEGVRLADEMCDMELQILTRQWLISACFAGGEPDKLLVAFSWCVAKCDEHESLFDMELLLWHCKHVLGYPTMLPQISREQIEQITTDVLERYRRHGASPRGPYTLIMSSRFSMGDSEEGKRYHDLWQDAPRDWWTEPEDWELFFEVDYLYELEEIDRAFQLAQPMFKIGERGEIYPWLVDLFVYEMIRRGDLKRVANWHRRVMRAFADNPKHMGKMARQIHVLTLTGNFTRALSLLERCFPWRMKSRTPGADFFHDLQAWCAMRLILQQGEETLSLRLPDEFELYRENGHYDTQDLATWFETSVRHWESQFNARNGNAYFTEIVDDSLTMQEFAGEYRIG